MSKRLQEFKEKNSKKFKLDDDIDALWGEDDLDESALDDCIKLATQAFEEDKITFQSTSRNNILCYREFKEANSKICSTQLEYSNDTLRQSTKNIPFLLNKNKNHLEKEIEDLKKKYQEKEGEVTILRAQLNDAKINLDKEQSKVQNEWKKKHLIIERQIQTIKSELEFKNLEIANLKQKLLDISKRSVSSNETHSNKNKQPVVSTSVSNDTTELPPRLHIMKDTSFPMNQFNAELLFKFPKKENCIFQSKGFHTNRNAISYLQNRKKIRLMCLNDSEISIHILPVLQKLICFSEFEINSSNSTGHINKVIIVALILIEDLYNLLQRIKSSLKTENILQADTDYIKRHLDKKNLENYEDNEIGFNAGIIIHFLAKILPHSNYLIELFGSNCTINLKKGVDEDTFLRHGRIIKGHDILHRVIDIVKLSGEIRNTKMTLFLGACITLFMNICKSGKYTSIVDPFCTFTKELIFLRPNDSVVYEMIALFKEASKYSSFIEFILNKAKNCSSTKRGVVYFNTNACRFYVFALMFEKNLQKCIVPMDVCLNVLCFMYNSFSSSHWVHHQDIKECECLPQLYMIVFDLLWRVLALYKEAKRTNSQHLSEWNYFIRNKIIFKLLSLMTFHSYDLTEKYIAVLSQYKEIEKYCEEDSDTTDTKPFSILEDLPEVPLNKFKIDL